LSGMPKISRLNVNSDWIDLDFMERERTPEQAVELGIQMHVAGLSLSNTTSVLEELGVERSRKAVHDWVHKADLQPDDGRSPDHIAIDETVIRINDKQFWLYAAVDPTNNHLLHVRLFHSTTTAATRMFLRELSEKHDIENSLFLVDGAQHLQTALRRSGLRFRYVKHGNRNSAERVFRELKRRTQAFSNCFSNAQPETAEEWLLAFASWHNAN
jgi:putative transposase